MSNVVDSISTLAEIRRFNQDRDQDLLRIKYARMADSAFAFFRGTNHLFAARWPEFRPFDVGPNLLICGDLHLENFGAYQTENGGFRYDVNDFDEALVAPCSADLIRCTASILLAADAWNISPVRASTIACDFLSAYHATIAEAAGSGQIGDVAPGRGDGPIWDLLSETALGVRADLLDRNTQSNKHGERRILRSDEKRPDVDAHAAEAVRSAIQTLLETEPHPVRQRVLDVAGRIAGIGSLGVRRFLVLVAGGAASGDCRLLDVKECRASALLSCSTFSQPDLGASEADRVVQAQRRLQSSPAAGLAVIHIDGRPYRVRELVPDENRSKLDRLQKKPDKLHAAVSVVGRLAGWSQARGCALGEADALRKAAAWVAGPGLDAILVSAIRCAASTARDYESFRGAYADHKLDHP